MYASECTKFYASMLITLARTQVAVTESLLDRLEDCKRTFPVVAVLGGAGTALPFHLQAEISLCFAPAW